jgi:hypothetical protein
MVRTRLEGKIISSMVKPPTLANNIVHQLPRLLTPVTFSDRQ